MAARTVVRGWLKACVAADDRTQERLLRTLILNKLLPLPRIDLVFPLPRPRTHVPPPLLKPRAYMCVLLKIMSEEEDGVLASLLSYLHPATDGTALLAQSESTVYYDNTTPLQGLVLWGTHQSPASPSPLLLACTSHRCTSVQHPGAF